MGCPRRTQYCQVHYSVGDVVHISSWDALDVPNTVRSITLRVTLFTYLLGMPSTYPILSVPLLCGWRCSHLFLGCPRRTQYCQVHYSAGDVVHISSWDALDVPNTVRSITLRVTLFTSLLGMPSTYPILSVPLLCGWRCSHLFLGCPRRTLYCLLHYSAGDVVHISSWDALDVPNTVSSITLRVTLFASLLGMPSTYPILSVALLCGWRCSHIFLGCPRRTQYCQVHYSAGDVVHISSWDALDVPNTVRSITLRVTLFTSLIGMPSTYPILSDPLLCGWRCSHLFLGCPRRTQYCQVHYSAGDVVHISSWDALDVPNTVRSITLRVTLFTSLLGMPSTYPILSDPLLCGWRCSHLFLGCPRRTQYYQVHYSAGDVVHISSWDALDVPNTVRSITLRVTLFTSLLGMPLTYPILSDPLLFGWRCSHLFLGCPRRTQYCQIHYSAGDVVHISSLNMSKPTKTAISQLQH